MRSASNLFGTENKTTEPRLEDDERIRKKTGKKRSEVVYYYIQGIGYSSRMGKYSTSIYEYILLHMQRTRISKQNKDVN